MTSKLATVHSRLSALRRQRWLLRVGTGAMAFLAVLLGWLIADFLLDWLCEFSRAQRGLLLVVFVAVAVWGWRRYLAPALREHETEIDLALLIERRQGIDSDLVAALQFESPQAPAWGSVQLEGAVVDRAASLGSVIPADHGLTDNRFRRHAVVLGTVAAGVAIAALAFPRHSAVFFNRFFLGSAHYPTKTTITRIAINGTVVFPGGRASSAFGVPYGSSLKFEVNAEGEIPDSGEIQLVAPESGGATRVILARSQDGIAVQTPRLPGAAETAAPQAAVYGGEFARLVETVSYQVFLGDAWTDPATIRIIALPVVSLELDHTPPPYAAAAKSAKSSSSSRQISVVEGSSVTLLVRCGNKPLANAELVIGPTRYRLERQDDERRVWRLPAALSPLARVVEPMPLEVEVIDDDGLSPEQPLRGHIRIQSDRPPRVAAAAVTEKVLPAARPGIVWGAADDFGVAEIRLRKEVTRAGGDVEQSVDVVRRIPASEQPQPSLRGRYAFDLKPLSLAKGDQVRVTLEAVDYRGDQSGSSAQSESLIFQVTDESGILAGLVEADEKSARQLDQIIQRQLGIGESR